MIDIALSRIIQNVSFRYTLYVNHRNNPVRASIVTSASQYPWSSHHAYIGKEDVPWLTTELVLAQFAKQKEKAITLYQNFITDGNGEEYRKEFYQGNVAGVILGEDRFAEEAFAKSSQKMVLRVTLEQVLDTVCGDYGISVDSIASGSREKRVAEPRAMAALLVREAPHLRLIDLSRKLKRDLSGLSQASSRLEQKLTSNDNLRKKVEKFKDILG